MCIQAFGPELAVEGLNEGVVGWPAGPGEVENDVALVGPKVEIARSKLCALVDPDRRWESNVAADALQDLHDVRTAKGEACLGSGAEPRKGIDDCEDADLAAGGELIVNEVHGPGLVDLGCIRSTFTQLRFDATSRRFVTQLQAQLPAQTIDACCVECNSAFSQLATKAIFLLTLLDLGSNPF
jgi:hypothetical protein